MKKSIKRLGLALAVIIVLIAVFTAMRLINSQQYGDGDFNAAVANPTYKEKRPKVLFDEAHHNFHTTTGSYKPFVDLITNDGYQVVVNKEKFTADRLNGHDLLVIANAMGAWPPFMPGSGDAAFTAEECDVVFNWVDAGGSLLLIADHAPAGGAAQNLSRRFGVEMSNLYLFDTAHADRGPNAQDSWVIYSRDNGMLTDHAITRGRDDREKINSVTTFTGQSLKGGEGSIALLKLTWTAGDYDPRTGKETPATDRAQAVVLKVGRGRVAVLGEAGMITAQVSNDGKIRFGMQRPGNDNKQFALNLMHWLSDLLD